MRRRDFIAGVAGLAGARPLAARAQQPMPVIGYLGTTTADDFASRLAAFHEGLKQVGYIEGQNVAIEYRWPEGRNDRLPALAADLVRRQVASYCCSRWRTFTARGKGRNRKLRLWDRQHSVSTKSWPKD